MSRQSLYPWLWRESRPKRSMREIASAVAEQNALTLEELRSDSRRQRIAHARQKAMAAIYATGDFSLKQIGIFFRRDHATVLYACRAAWLPKGRRHQQAKRLAA